MKSERLEVKNTDSHNSMDVKDSVKEVTTVTVQLNDVGDTVFRSVVKNRDCVRSMADVRSMKEEVRVVRDTVYVERRDSVQVLRSRFQDTCSSISHQTSSVSHVLRWIFGILICVIVLVIFIKVKRLTCG